MNKSIEIIQKHARVLKKLEENEIYLFEQLTYLNAEIVKQLIKNYTSEHFQPVNFLRLEILNNLKKNITLTPELIQELKDKIKNKDRAYFSKYSESLLKDLQQYPKDMKSIFGPWDKNFNILFPFFHRSKDKEESKNALETIANELMETLKFDQYVSHNVSFVGSNHFGRSSCWIAIHPENVGSFKQYYQLYLEIHGETMKAGFRPRDDIKDKTNKSIESFNNIEDVIEKLNNSYETVVNLNNKLIDVNDNSNSTDISNYAKLLNHKKQLILYGPPGTGKTYNAREIAVKFIDGRWRN